MKKKLMKLSLLFLAVVCVVGMLGCAAKPATPAVAQPTLFDRVAALESQIQSVNSKSADYSTKIATIESNQGKFATNENVNSQISVLSTLVSKSSAPTNMATKDDVASLTSQYNTLKTQLDTAIATNTALKTQLDALTAKVNATPTPTPTGTSGTTNVDKISVSVTDMYGLQIQEGAFDFTDSQDAIKLKITNNNTVDITDLTLYIYLVADDNISPSTIASKSLSGGISCTYINGDDYSEFKYRTGRISLSAGKTKTYYLTPSIQIKPQYAYRDFYTNIETNSTTTPTVPADGTVKNNPVNITPTSSKLQNDVGFELTYDIIDYNLN